MAVSLICPWLVDGQVTAIDRSAKMIESATRRNAADVAAGRAVFDIGDFEEASFGGQRFDKIFAFHVAAFWRSPDVMLRRAAGLLNPDGSLYLFNEIPGWSRLGTPQSFADRLGSVLADYDYRVVATEYATPPDPPAVCVVAVPLSS